VTTSATNKFRKLLDAFGEACVYEDYERNRGTQLVDLVNAQAEKAIALEALLKHLPKEVRKL